MEQDLTRLPCSSFCGRCHELEKKEYETLYLETVDPECAQTCADCHMPQYLDRLTQGHLLSLIHPKRPVHDHSFPLYSEAVTGGAVEVTRLTGRLRPDSQVAIEVTLVNRGAGHRIPTGEYGHNELRLLVTVLDSDDRVVGETEDSVFAGYHDALAPGEPTHFLLQPVVEDSGKPLRVKLLVEMVNKDRSFRYTLVRDETVVGEPVD